MLKSVYGLTTGLLSSFWLFAALLSSLMISGCASYPSSSSSSGINWDTINYAEIACGTAGCKGAGDEGLMGIGRGKR